MDKRFYKKLVFVTFAFAVLLTAAKVIADSTISTESTLNNETQISREYQVKAAFVYNFMKFTEWPKDKKTDETETKSKAKAMTIGVIGKYPFGKAFDPILTKTVGERKILIKRFVGVSQYRDMSGNSPKYKLDYSQKYADDMKKCHVMYVCSSEDEFVKDITSMLEGSGVLTVGEGEKFIEKGGMITFVMKKEGVEAKKLRFEVNLDNVKKAGISISSKLLKLAKRIIKDEQKK
ncbi:MAG: YfiR family protein [Anaerohalosphaera sp.]|nr:YfiR family protein [Anaerohalosphaera sp.]